MSMRRTGSKSSVLETSEARCYGAAVRLLASREYSLVELSTKLGRRFVAAAVQQVVGELHEQGTVDDERYGEAFCRSRAERGYGPMFIARELEQNGLDKELIETLLEPYEDRWLDNAKAQVRKKTSNGHRALGQLDNKDQEEGKGDKDLATECSAEQRREAWQQAQKDRARLARFLARRGFSATIASRAIHAVLTDLSSHGSTAEL